MFLNNIDVLILQFVNLSYHLPFLDMAAQFFSIFGLVWFGLALAVILYLYSTDKSRMVAKELVIVLIAVFILTQIIKLVIARPRPFTVIDNLNVLTSVNDASFPSGHTATVTAIAYVLARNYGYRILLAILVILVGLSRLYLGVHYPSDVLGGFIIGLLITLGCEYVIKRFS